MNKYLKQLIQRTVDDFDNTPTWAYVLVLTVAYAILIFLND